MAPSPHQKARSRAEILSHAGRLFRLRGYEGTNIDDVMLAAGLTRGAFYAHFPSKDALFAEVLAGGSGLLGRLRSGEPRGVLKAYLAKDELAATIQGCNLAALSADVARGPLAARLAYANLIHAAIVELARGKRRRLESAATTAVILAIGAVILARACGERRLADWMLRCAHRAVQPLIKPQGSPAKRRSRSRRKGAGARRAKPAARSPDGRAAGAPGARSSAARR
jgi:TetR/AcrR family transcriptional repressor of nem operon